MRRSLLLSATLSLALYADISVQKVLVEQSALQANTDLQADEVKFTRQQDLAEILSGYIPEINMVRASAIGNDIVLRGFKRDDINVLIDGAKIYGGCPNRMDPPAMHISIADIAKVEVAEGPFDVENFGSMGGEYRLGFSKRVVFLKTPAEYEGGADLQFRDDFADAVCEVEDLENAIEAVLKKSVLSDSELQNMRQQVLSFSAAADDEAARTINAICSAS